MPTVLPERQRPEQAARPSLARRLLWFIGLWGASVAGLGVVAYVIRLWIAP